MFEKIFKSTIVSIAFLGILILVFIFGFILKESLHFFYTVNIVDFICGDNWNPMGSAFDLSILPMILGTLYTSFLGLFLSLPIGIGTALYISLNVRGNKKDIIRIIIDILAGIPSVIFGFIGLLVIVKFLEQYANLASGETVLAAGILLAIMMLPYIISNCVESMDKIYSKYYKSSICMGVNKIYFMRKIILPKSLNTIIVSAILSLGRGLGETMAVMMVIGNAAIFPRLMGKGYTIPSLVAMEMGMAEVGSMHYQALFASGFILMVMILFINFIAFIVKRKFQDR